MGTHYLGYGIKFLDHKYPIKWAVTTGSNSTTTSIFKTFSTKTVPARECDRTFQYSMTNEHSNNFHISDSISVMLHVAA